MSSLLASFGGLNQLGMKIRLHLSQPQPQHFTRRVPAEHYEDTSMQGRGPNNVSYDRERPTCLRNPNDS